MVLSGITQRLLTCVETGMVASARERERTLVVETLVLPSRSMKSQQDTMSMAALRSRRMDIEHRWGKSLVILTRAVSALCLGWVARLELLKYIIVIKVDLKLRCNYPLKNSRDEW